MEWWPRRVPIENLRTIFEQEGRLRYGEDTYEWLLLTRDGIIISEKSSLKVPGLAVR